MPRRPARRRLLPAPAAAASASFALPLAFAFLLLSSFLPSATGESTDVVAHYQSYVVGKGSEVDVSLLGFHFNNKKYTYSVTSPPATGSIFHPSQVYCDYSYEPKKGAAISAATASSPEPVGCNTPSLIYTYAKNAMLPTEGPLDRFSYIVTDAAGAVSYPGVVHLLNADRVLAGSFFNRNSDGWTVAQNGPRASAQAVTWDMSSRGALNRYVYAEEDSTDMVAGVDQDLWYFRSPAKFTGDMAAAYGGELRFTLSSAAGDFSALTPGAYAVKLECATCRTAATQDKGVQLYFPASALASSFDGATKEIVVSISEAAGWLKDSENTQVAWVAPTQCELVQVLKRLSSIMVLGDYTQGFESVALDSVVLKAGPNMSVPLTCYASAHFIA